MSDNTQINVVTNPGDIISTEDFGGYKLPRSKIALGDHGFDTGNVSAANPMPVTGKISSNSQTATVINPQINAVANGNGTVANVSGNNGAIQCFISNGAGTCTITLQGSSDNFATAQSAITVGCVLLADSVNGANSSRFISNAVISVQSNTTSVYQISEPYPYIQAILSNATSLGAGTTVTGCSVSLYALPQ